MELHFLHKCYPRNKTNL